MSLISRLSQSWPSPAQPTYLLLVACVPRAHAVESLLHLQGILVVAISISIGVGLVRSTLSITTDPVTGILLRLLLLLPIRLLIVGRPCSSSTTAAAAGCGSNGC